MVAVKSLEYRGIGVAAAMGRNVGVEKIYEENTVYIHMFVVKWVNMVSVKSRSNANNITYKCHSQSHTNVRL